jgi:hypothetical protein
MTRTVFLTATVALTLLIAPARAANPDPKEVEFFEKKIRPVLVEQCYRCHSAEAKKVKGGLFLDSAAAVLKGGDTGPALVPGKPDESLLFQTLTYQHDVKMPPKGQLPAAVLADFRHWIEKGAVDPRAGGGPTTATIDWSSARSFWSFQPVRKPTVPTVKDISWPKTDIDRFVLARLEAEGLRPVGPADKRTLIRRVTFDLTGLPPTPEEVEAFLADNSPGAYDKVVDRLLASPAYGERWARHWLDVARYAEDQAHTFDVKPNTQAFRYRDWVIDAFNRDLPYDRFVQLQIAADQMNSDANDRAALGFFGLGAQYYKNTDAARAAADELDDRIDTLARGFLGLTVSCARCHDHKFDPIPTQDYYSLAGIFSSCKLAPVYLASNDEVERYQTGQKQLLEAEKHYKDALQVERTRLAGVETERLPSYLLAAYQVRMRRLEDPKFSVAEQAKQEGLNPVALERMVKFLESNNKTSQALVALDGWRKLPAPVKGVTEPSADVRRTAEDFKKTVHDALKGGLPLPNAKVQGGADKNRQELLKSLFGDSGVFALSEMETLAHLEGDRAIQVRGLQTEMERVRKLAPPMPPIAHGLSEANVADMKVFIRGNPAQLGEPAPRRFLRVLSSDTPASFTKGSGRLELAQAIASPDNPLTARVFVNRVWAWQFGHGLVGTPSNLGKLGEAPTHPELLDYLASRFVESGWSIKALQRDIVRSAVYQLASMQTDEGQRKDPDNRLLWRGKRKRLDIESWRDALLATSGRLDRSLGGPTQDLDNANNTRRTVYARISRHDLNGLLRLFDFPDPNITSEKRTETTVPQQQLFVLNSPFFLNQARALAARVQKEANDDPGRVRRAYLLTYGRTPTDDEVQLALRFLTGKDDPAEASRNRLSRWERYAQVLLESNEFLYID